MIVLIIITVNFSFARYKVELKDAIQILKILAGMNGLVNPQLEEGVFSVLDPRGWTPERQVVALSPRLDSMDNKTIGLLDSDMGCSIIHESAP
ncbi:MAG: hypothetical protein OMM_09464 [Candidatus Magnetoglobus multicellularis str. Araruama]|uniref:Uncharacterized protein n=1 Tax=Candidatus Magnetoglobus multicellularis str. Araruama TaxID=890399 RepID=A0A1V1P3W1_9BACT|nr:MAG: hypothetical protein OMM_09464 [Candidatus Magnetoglobus multicellularis str. Araruama]